MMVLEYASGGDLYNLLRQAGGRLPEQQAVELVLQPFLSALAYMHSKGIVHRCDQQQPSVVLAAIIKLPDYVLCRTSNIARLAERGAVIAAAGPALRALPPLATARPLLHNLTQGYRADMLYCMQGHQARECAADC